MVQSEIKEFRAGLKPGDLISVWPSSWKERKLALVVWIDEEQRNRLEADPRPADQFQHTVPTNILIEGKVVRCWLNELDPPPSDGNDPDLVQIAFT